MPTQCACQSGNAYESCCGRYIDSDAPAPTPEALMRSRYTAYTLGNINYIATTMQGPAAKDFDRASTEAWATGVNWKGLTVIFSKQNDDTHGTVEFIARFTMKSHARCIYEISEFIKENNRWYYVDGNMPEVKRNQKCPCLSGKKAKQCCFKLHNA